ncbi:S1 RNA-binding domain-containing protein [Bhargavaea ullalensis]|uniref:S1 motif domain-containing protein n=1 Tax=Bhargavaea ullalensis TaxID=1265685 RepID=A0ABV2GCK5_9BACL
MEQERLAGRAAERAGVRIDQARAVIALLAEGKTVPFIARYRKEATGSLDEVQIKAVEDAHRYLTGLEERKEEVIRLIGEQGQLDPELEAAIRNADVLQRVEDLYRPFQKKRKTRAGAAKERGLEPLADLLLEGGNESPERAAAGFVDAEKEVPDTQAALDGAKDIIAERISDDPGVRETVRRMIRRSGLFTAVLKKGAEDPKGVYEMYYDYSEPLRQIKPHRVLAANRGEKEGVLKVAVKAEEGPILTSLEQTFIRRPNSPLSAPVREAAADAWKRLLLPSLEREIRGELTEQADAQAIRIFSENLKRLLLQPPMRGVTVLGVDPAFRTGCKLAVVDEAGRLLELGVIYPHPPQKAKDEAMRKVSGILRKHPISVIAIGNGTASRETEQFIADCLKEMDTGASYVIVNEAGASVYSASEEARREFPDLQVEQRSAVSIARRLQDPLSELVKIDPKSVGVGQYQHDVSQKNLAEQLDFVVETAVNRVGVDVNTASPSLLQHVSGLSRAVADNIAAARDELGSFTSRTQLKKVPRLGAKTYEQAVGFLRVPGAKNPLDATGVHPESYKLAEEILKLAGVAKSALGTGEAYEKLAGLDAVEVAGQLDSGEVTVRDIIETLMRPNRDPRSDFPQPLLRKEVLSIKDLKPGMEMEGTVRNVVDFGAFVDIGVGQDGLVHKSKMSVKAVRHPLDVVAPGDIVTVRVEEADPKKERIALSMISEKEQAEKEQQETARRKERENRDRMAAELKPGAELEGVVREKRDFGVFVDVGTGRRGLLHISKARSSGCRMPEPGERLKVKVEQYDRKTGRLSLDFAEKDKGSGARG